MRSIIEAPAPIERPTSRAPVGRPPLLGFVADAETERVMRECLAHLAMPQGEIMRGGIAKAIEYLGSQRSPNTLIVDISGIDLPVSQILALEEVCEPGVVVIAIGTRNEIGLYRDLMQAGVSEYVVKPLNTQLLAKALSAGPAAGTATPIHLKLGTMVAVIGARGGVGTTTLAVNLAWHLANRQSRRVALVDLDLQNGDCALALDIKPTSGLREALVNPARIDSTLLERVMMPIGSRLFVLSSEEPLRDNLRLTPEAVETLVTALRDQFHYVILDVPRTPEPPYQRALDLADFRIIVCDQTLRAVRDTVRLRSSLGEVDGQRRTLLVVNRHGEGGRLAVTLQEMRKVLDLRPSAVIPFEPKSFMAALTNSQAAASRRGKLADAIGALVLEVSGRPPERRRWWSSAK
jgi:pilus assembly protein CpaE